VAARAAAGVSNIRRGILGLILFGIAFGFVEAAVVVYLRTLTEPIRVSLGFPPGSLFPLFTRAQVAPRMFLAKVELAREAATILMLASVAATIAKNRRSWLAAFGVAFGVWDLAFYASLKVLIAWPQSWMTWDILFLLPVPWIGPVLAPIIIAASLVAGGLIALLRQPPKAGWLSTLLLTAGGVIVFIAFIWDWEHIASGGMPRSFPWLIFLTGELAGALGLLVALRKAAKTPLATNEHE
jgi:hypothetical protein